MSAPIIHWIRPGVGYAPEAAASMLRVEAELGRPHQSNSSYRDYNKQLGMYRAWNAYVAGRGPKPPHSRAIHPDVSKHCQGLADDSNEWVDLDYRAVLADHGWIRTAASDLTERHHFEYQSWRDSHRHEGVPSTSGQTPPTSPEEEDDMYTDEDRKRDNETRWLVGQMKPSVDEVLERAKRIEATGDVNKWALTDATAGLRQTVATILQRLGKGA